MDQIAELIQILLHHPELLPLARRRLAELQAQPPALPESQPQTN